MSDPSASAPVAEDKKPKKRIKKKSTKKADQEEPAVLKVRPTGRAEMNFEDKQMVDYVREATKKNVWYYRDRMSVPRGPCSLPVLRECWVHGIIDQNTLVWGHGLADWLPVQNVRTLVPQIRTLEGMNAASLVTILCTNVIRKAFVVK